MDALCEFRSFVFMEPRWFTVAGLILDVIGAAIIILSVVTTRRGAAKATGFVGPDDSGIPMWSEGWYTGGQPPQVTDRLTQSWFAVAGGVFILFGFLLQAIGAWPC